MRNHSRVRGAVAAATAAVVALAAGWTAAGAAAGDTSPAPAPADAPPAAVETLAYPGSTQILAARGITLARGDGGILLTDCGAAGSFQIRVRAITTPPNPDDAICFAAPGASGYLALSVPNAYRVSTYGRSVRASLSTDQKPTETVNVGVNGTVGIGESLDPKARAVVLELRVTGSSATPPPAQPVDPATAFTAKLNIGDGKRACTGTLVDQSWLLTAASCFTDTPNDLSTVTAGAPKDKTTATIGRADLANTTTGMVDDVVELVPRPDRDLVMARLAVPVSGIAPAVLATTAPATGQSLRIPGYGRTATEWVPRKLHTTAHTAAAVGATTLDTAPADGQAPLCQGDAGAPLLRDNGGKTELAAVATRSWQGGCLDAPAAETRTGATATRTDDLGAWITARTDRSYAVLNPGSGRCLNAAGAGPAWNNGTPIGVWDCTLGADNEQFKLTADGHIYNPASNRCFNVSGAGPVWNNGTPIVLWDCNADWANEKFEWTPTGQLRNPASGRCLNVTGAGPVWDNGTPVVAWDCSNEGWANEKFRVIADNEMSNPVGLIKNPASGRCLNLTGAGPVWPNGTKLILVDCADVNNEHFQLTADGHIYNYASNRCLNVFGAGPVWDNGTPIVAWDCSTESWANEKFEWTPTGQLRNPASGRCLNVTGAGPVWNNNTPIVLWDCSNEGWANEKFQLVSVKG
ncbi:RICIN domain-containing protein [Kitasatospora sp. NPDC059408]|uniref:RICIN domain-containing protein n=1 Tax=Kitasatospora sp. NPDC059408 TaxID=3346823 RepID=UPI0036A55E8D